MSYPPITVTTAIFSDVLLVHEATRVPPPNALYLKDAAYIILDLIATVERDGDEHLRSLAKDAVALFAVIWRSYLESSTPQLWPSQELSGIIIETTVTLHSAKQFVMRRVKTRTAKLYFMRRVKLALDAPRMKAYRNQLSHSAQMAQVAILKLNAADTVAAATSMRHIHSAGSPHTTFPVDHGSRILGEQFENLQREGESMAQEPSATPTDYQAHWAPNTGPNVQTHASDDGSSEEAPEERFNDTFSRQLPVQVINIMFVSHSAVAIGGGNANVHTRI